MPPTSVAFMKAAATLGITHTFTRYNNPKGNADPKRLMRTRKNERVWLREWTSPLELEQALVTWIEWYNTRHLHSMLGYRTPCQVGQQHLASHSTQFVSP